MTIPDIVEDVFYKAFRGSFIGILRWPQFDELWDVLKSKADDEWYIYATAESPPDKTASKTQYLEFLSQSESLLKQEHQEDYCGVVYVDDKTNPTFVKIFDPNNLGVSCGYSDNPPLPGWIISRMPPSDLKNTMLQTASRKRWWQKIFGN